jgi:putative flippase GtrA
MPKKPSKKAVKQFAYFNLGGLSFFVVGYAVFSLLYGVLSWEWWAAKIIGDLTGWTVNYIIQRFLAFSEESRGHSERNLLVRFSALSLVNVVIDYAIVWGLKAVGVSPFIGLFAAASFFTIWKFIWYKLWVFKSSSKTVA